MTIINEHTVVVFTSAELKSALENNNGYINIFLGNDITLESGPKINSNKSIIIIDGTYEGVRHRLTDKKSLSTGDVINASIGNTKITVQNLDVTGYNYYGIVFVADSSSYKNIVVEYQNITYVGPQICFHPFGLTRFINCDITIEDSYASGNEVAECNQIEIGGTTTIVHKSTGNSSFWFRNANTSFKILANAVVHFTSVVRELIYGVTDLAFTIQKNASFYINAKNGMGYGTFGTGITILEEGSLLSLTQTGTNGSYPAWYSYGKITVNNDASLIINSSYTGIGASNYCIYFNSANAGLSLLNPKKVILYNTKANVIYASTSIPFQFSFSRINLFTNSITLTNPISLDTLPTYSWYKDYELSSIEGTFTQNNTVITSHNFTSEELTNLPSLTNFIFPTKKIFSIGDVYFHVGAVTDLVTEMNGVTFPNASILISYLDVSTVILADNTGAFSYTYDSPLEIGTIVTFQVKDENSPIYKTKIIEIVWAGELTLDSATSVINFNLEPISLNPIICPRADILSITVTDSRINSSNWKLYASINHDLESSTGITLKDSLVYKNENGELQVLSETPTLVYTGSNNDGVTKVTNVSWNDTEGILFQVTEPIINKVEYTALITWTIEE